jgi:hypothetical protein
VTIALHRSDARVGTRRRTDRRRADDQPTGRHLTDRKGADRHLTDRHAAAPSPAASLLAVLRDGLLACAEVDPTTLDARTPAGSAAVRLAALARAGVATLGAAPRAALVTGPGVVVVRDLAVATALLDATDPRDPDDAGVAERLAALTAEADRALASLRGAVTRVA